MSKRTNQPSELDDEKAFLHDLASPLAAAVFLVDSLCDSLKAGQVLEPTDLEGLRALQKSIAKSAECLNARQALLRERAKSAL